MDFPIFHLDGMGNRMLIAVIAIIHVMINHPLAVGIYPLITLLEWRGRKLGDERLDQFAKRITFVVFIITTSLGALTGVGIWFSTSLVAPFAIGSLIRVFFWAWFAEWIVFITEVMLILLYYMTWDRWNEGRAKSWHIGLGVTLSLMSWATMAIIVAILGFMMSVGSWEQGSDLLTAVLNPIYLPQLAFRTTLALATAGLFAWFMIGLIPKSQQDLRVQVTRFVSAWTLFWMPFWGLAAWWYMSVVPDAMKGLIPLGMMTQKFITWQDALLWASVGVISFIGIVALTGLLKPRWVPRAALLIPFFLGIALLGHFERVREFIRKPYVIAGFMYSNGVRVDEVEFYRQHGILPYSSFSSVTKVTEENKLAAGKDLFVISCSRCHTTNGMNGIDAKLTKLYGEQWDPAQMNSFVRGMHLSHPYMPPFPGNEQESETLVAYLIDLHENPAVIAGAQVAGIPHPIGVAREEEQSERLDGGSVAAGLPVIEKQAERNLD
ncbi:cytochrome c [Blastopirellula sp. JC732]|uniref:Cytochrome c n=1 Tax=Blastopirellula sediminis TaxID=2894196 RepID=A0A9X1ML22_9BACT|nr:cytochrome c [Blastopirellula sediminis]MCC9607723.1 cytochrome c [Blastopirellula sediminis]MCC9627484.1 cytochrome c [Blastopirellula sediminis]